MGEAYKPGQILLYRSGPDTGVWGVKHTTYEQVEVIKCIAEKIKVNSLRTNLDMYVNPRHLYLREELDVIDMKISMEESQYIIKDSIYKIRFEAGETGVYGISAVDGKETLLEIFSGKGHQKLANEYLAQLMQKKES